MNSSVCLILKALTINNMLLYLMVLSGQGLPSAGCRPSGFGDPRHGRCSHLCQRSHVTPFPWGSGAELHSSCAGLCSLHWALRKLQFARPRGIHPPQSAASTTGRLARLLLLFLRLFEEKRNISLILRLCPVGFFFHKKMTSIQITFWNVAL